MACSTEESGTDVRQKGRGSYNITFCDRVELSWGCLGEDGVWCFIGDQPPKPSAVYSTKGRKETQRDARSNETFHFFIEVFSEQVDNQQRQLNKRGNHAEVL